MTQKTILERLLSGAVIGHESTCKVPHGGGEVGTSDQGNMATELLEGSLRRGESSTAILACNDFLRFGPARSVRGLAQIYKERPKHETPTQSYDTLRRWSEKYEWTKRAREYDGRRQREALEARQQILKTGHRHSLARLETLNKISQILEEQVLEVGAPKERKVIARCPKCSCEIQIGTGELVKTYPDLWKTNVKQVGHGDSLRVTTTHQFNGAIISTLRNVMNDIAQETGGRRINVAHRIMNRIDISRMPLKYLDRLSSSDDIEDVLVDIIEMVYKDLPIESDQKLDGDR